MVKNNTDIDNKLVVLTELKFLLKSICLYISVKN